MTTTKDLNWIIETLRIIANYEDCRIWKGNMLPTDVTALGQFIETDLSQWDDNAIEYWTLSRDGEQLLYLADMAERAGLALAPK